MGARVLAVVQARLGSTRLPGKTLMEIAGRPMLAHVVERASAIPGVEGVVLAIPDNILDNPLAELANSAGVPVVRGSEENVLDRFRVVLSEHRADVIVRVTADCPLLDPEVSGGVVAEYMRRQGQVDYVSNVEPRTYPDGLDTEVFSREALLAAWRGAHAPDELEHVTLYIRRHPERFRRANVAHSEDLSALRWTVDTAEDLEFVRAVYGFLSQAGTHRFGMARVLALLREHPDLWLLNAGVEANEGVERAHPRQSGGQH